jgi:hypothetical protein
MTPVMRERTHQLVIVPKRSGDAMRPRRGAGIRARD